MLTWKCFHLYADEQGVTRVDPEYSFKLQEVPFAPPAPSVFVARAPSASGIVFIELPIGWKGGWHPSPKIQWVICLSGRMEYETGDGTRFKLEPGSYIFSSDVSGVGHNSWNAGDEPVRLAAVQA
jgi:quercetin dioxygenase-like cupin family protein